MRFHLLPCVAFALFIIPACHSPGSTSVLGQQNVPPAPLRNTHWVLRQLATEPVTVPEGGRELYLLLRADQARAEGNGGCNRFSGSFEQPTPEQLRFGNLLSTKMACPALEVEAQFMSALSKVAYYRITGDTLQLYPGPPTETQPMARFQAVYTH